MVNEILRFIKRFPPCDWTTRNCYYFAIILLARFPFLQLYYDAVAGHFIVGAPNVNNPYGTHSNISSIYYFDWNGIYSPLSEPILFEELKERDEAWYGRIVRDCIL